jgi:hypothetical protein
LAESSACGLAVDFGSNPPKNTQRRNLAILLISDYKYRCLLSISSAITASCRKRRSANAWTFAGACGRPAHAIQSDARVIAVASMTAFAFIGLHFVVRRDGFGDARAQV